MFSTFIIRAGNAKQKEKHCRYKVNAQKYKIAGIVNLANWRQKTFKKVQY